MVSFAESELLFVYGTLLRSEPQGDALLAEADYLGPARIASGFELRDLGDYPAALPCADAGPLYGELYRVPQSLWAALDAYEDERLFGRREVDLAGGQRAQMYLWLGEPPTDAPLILSGDWRRR